MSQKAWKKNLLRSSFPFEYEVAKILSNEKFYINSDFSYRRLDGNQEKEFSVDILATCYYPFGDESQIDLDFDLLVECKYRDPNKEWIFLPQVRHPHDQTSDSMIEFVDSLSVQKFMKLSNFYLKDVAYKGMEVNLDRGDVHDAEILHGLSQLIFAAPVVIKNNVLSSITSDAVDVSPFAIANLLVTSAQLRIVNEDFSVEKLKASDELLNFSRVVPYLIYNHSGYDSLTTHVKNLFQDVPNNFDSNVNLSLYSKLHEVSIPWNNSPDGQEIKLSSTRILINQLKEGETLYNTKNILICNIDYLEMLLKDIKDIVAKVGDSIVPANSNN